MGGPSHPGLNDRLVGRHLRTGFDDMESLSRLLGPDQVSLSAAIAAAVINQAVLQSFGTELTLQLRQLLTPGPGPYDVGAHEGEGFAADLAPGSGPGDDLIGPVGRLGRRGGDRLGIADLHIGENLAHALQLAADLMHQILRRPLTGVGKADVVSVPERLVHNDVRELAAVPFDAVGEDPRGAGRAEALNPTAALEAAR